MTEFPLQQTTFVKIPLRSSVFDVSFDNTDTFTKSKETADPNVLMNIMHRVVANSNHIHPRILSYKTYDVENNHPFWRVSVTVDKMKTNLVSLLLSKSYSNSSFSIPELLNHFYSLICALEYLHLKGLPHQNIKSENVLFDDDQVAYLSDCAHKNEKQEFMWAHETFNVKTNLYAKDIVALGHIFLKMCCLDIDNALSAITITQTLERVEAKYGREISDFINEMINSNNSGRVTAQSLRQFLEKRYKNTLRPITFKAQKKEMVSPSSPTNATLKAKIMDMDITEQALQPLQRECSTRKRTESLDIQAKNYLYLPWRYCKTAKNVSKYGILKNRELTDLKKCFKLSSCQGVEKMGKKVGLSGLELIQSNNIRIPATSITKETSKVQQLSSCLPQFPNLKDFQIEYSCGNLNCQDLTTLGKNILKLKHLKKLHLRFACGQTLGDNAISILGHLIQHSRKLEDLNIYLNKWAKVTDKGFKQFCYALSKLSKLKRLVLNMEEFEQIGSSGIVELGQSLAKLPHLTDLDLTLYRCSSIAGPQLAAFSEHISKFNNLKKLAINVKQSQGSMDQGLVGISKALSNLTDLRELRLNFLSCDVTEAGITKFGSSLAQLTHLNVLDLTFGNNDRINNKNFEPIATSIAKLTQLRSLKLVFFQCDKLTDGAIFYIAEALTQLQHLNDLELNFRWCTLIDDYGISKLGEAFLSLNFLNRLQLSLDGCRISDNGVSKLGQDLAKLQYLNDLKLEVRECKRIQGSGISKLGECLTKLVELGQIQLNFCGCGGNYRQRLSEGIISLKKSISKLPRVHMNDNSIAPYC